MVKHEAGTIIAESNKNLSNVHPAVVLLDLTILHKQNDSMSLIQLCAN